MAKKKKIELTDDVLSLVTNIHFGEMPFLKDKELPVYGIDMNSLFGGAFLLEDIARILGMYDEYVIKGTECDAIGPSFRKDVEDYFFIISTYIYDNLEDIETMIHYFSNKGGLKSGIYEYSRKTGLWSWEEDISTDNSEIFNLKLNINGQTV